MPSSLNILLARWMAFQALRSRTREMSSSVDPDRPRGADGDEGKKVPCTGSTEKLADGGWVLIVVEGWRVDELADAASQRSPDSDSE